MEFLKEIFLSNKYVKKNDYEKLDRKNYLVNNVDSDYDYFESFNNIQEVKEDKNTKVPDNESVFIPTSSSEYETTSNSSSGSYLTTTSSYLTTTSDVTSSSDSEYSESTDFSIESILSGGKGKNKNKKSKKMKKTSEQSTKKSSKKSNKKTSEKSTKKSDKKTSEKAKEIVSEIKENVSVDVSKDGVSASVSKGDTTVKVSKEVDTESILDKIKRWVSADDNLELEIIDETGEDEESEKRKYKINYRNLTNFINN